jgi:hypothetical protein
MSKELCERCSKEPANPYHLFVQAHCPKCNPDSFFNSKGWKSLFEGSDPIRILTKEELENEKK